MKIIADSCCDVTDELKRQLDIELIPLTIRPPTGEELVDDGSIDTRLLVKHMAECKEPFRTACPSVEEYARGMSRHDECVVVTLSSKLSGSYNAACAAREMVLEEAPEKKICVFDSKSASAGQLNIALLANKLAGVGMAFDAVTQRISEHIDKLHTMFVLENLGNMIKNGRMSKVKGLLATVLSIRPVLSDDGNGEIKLMHTVKGQKRALEKLVESIDEATKSRGLRSTLLTLSYCNCEERAEALRERILERCAAISNVLLVPTSGLSTVYAGDGGVIVSF